MANIDVNIDKILNLPKIQRIGIIAGVAVIILGLYGFLIYRGQAQVQERNGGDEKETSSGFETTP